MELQYERSPQGYGGQRNKFFENTYFNRIAVSMVSRNISKANVNDFVNPELKGKNSLELFDFAVQCCKEFGIKIMVDIHSPATDAMGICILYGMTVNLQQRYGFQLWSG